MVEQAARAQMSLSSSSIALLRSSKLRHDYCCWNDGVSTVDLKEESGLPDHFIECMP